MKIGTRLVALAITLGLAGSAEFAGAGRVVQQKTAVPHHVSVLEGAANFRDIGGYATADGRHVRRGLVYRSNQLSDLTSKDYERLNGFGIKLVCDFRTDGERQRQPTRWQGNPLPDMMHAPILKETDVVLSPERLRELTRSSAETLSASYERMVTPEPAAEYGRLYKRIAAGDAPVIAHCTAGKDRTGVFSAVLLTLVGVPRSGVIEDYMLTGEYMMTPQALSKAAVDLQKTSAGSEPPSESTLRAVYTMHAEVLTNTFATIDRLYGSFDGFVRDGLKLTPSEVASLRTQLLE